MLQLARNVEIIGFWCFLGKWGGFKKKVKKQCNVDVELIFTDKSCFRDESPKVNGYGGDALQLARNGQKMMRGD